MDIKKIIGDVPEVPVTVNVDNDTVIKLSVAVVLVATIIFLISALIKKNK